MQSSRDTWRNKAEASEERMNALGRFSGEDPANIVAALEEYVGWKSNDDIQAAINRVNNGGSASPAGNDNDEFLTDEEKQIQELKAQVSQLEGRLGGTEVSLGQQALTGHIEKVARDLHFTQPLFEASRDSMKKTLDEWGRTATRKDAAGEAARKAIRDIQGPGGLKMVKSLMLADIDSDALLDAQQNRDRRKQGALSELTTDGRPGQASTGREDPPDFSKSANAAIDAANWAERNPDSHDAR
jgi:hypothetical protein